MTAQPGPAARLYRRLGVRYFHLLLAIAAMSIPLLATMAAALVLAYANGSVGDYERLLLIVVPWGALVGLIVETMNARVSAPLIAWLRGERGPAAAERAWAAAVIGVPRQVFIGTGFVVLLSIPAVYVGAHQVDLTGPADFAGSAIGIAMIVISGGTLHYLLWERALAPVVADIARELPEDFEAPGTGQTLTRKLLALVLSMSALACFVAAGVSTDSLGPGGKVTLGVATAVVIAATLGMGMTLLLRRSLISPLSELLSAMKRIGAGDLETRLLPVSADEFGETRRHFNSMVDDLRRSAEDLRASRARIVAASAEARRNVERDLHDGAQQHLVLMNLKLGLLSRQLADDPNATKVLAELRGDLDRALAELRDLAHGIYPAVLTSDGLPGALPEAAREAAIPTAVDCDGAGRYPPDLEAAVYFCCLEALQNAAKHAGEGASATISLSQENGELRFAVEDDGAGFDAATAAESSGLQGMADRIGALGGEVRVESEPGHGTRVAGSVPVLEGGPG